MLSIKRLKSFPMLMLCVTVAGGLGVGLATTAQARQQSQPSFGARVDLVRLDVSVLDKQNQPVRGLAQGDFIIKEDGQALPIQTFAAVDLADDDAQAATWTRDVAPDVTSNMGVETERLIVMLLDPGTTDLFALRSTKAIAKDAIAQLGPADLAAVVCPTDTRQAQEFTHDRSRLLAAVDGFDAGREMVMDEVRMRALLAVTETLASVAARRKSVIWVTIGGGDSYTWRQVLTAARLGNVNIYPINPAGLEMPNPGAKDFEWALANISSRNKFLLATAGNTGGHAFINSNEFTSKVTQVFRETGSFYLLGYASPDTKADGNFHRLDVKVNRPGVTVHTRAGYYGEDPPDVRHPPPPPPSPAIDAIAGLVPKRDVPLTITAASFGAIGEPEHPVAISLGVARPAATDRAIDMDVVVEAFTFNGVLKKTVRVPAIVTPAAATDGEMQILARVDLPAGRYQLRAAAQSTALEKAGSVYVDLDVPDFTRDALSLSGVVMSPMPAPSATPARAFADFLPLVPVTTRTFGATDYVTAFFRVAQGGKAALAPVSLSTRIVNDKDAVVVTTTDRIEAGEFDAATRAIDHRYRVPLPPLPPGGYLLTFEATLGKTTVRRDVRFTVR